MTLTALANNKSQQPSVLQLLPFSRNDAGSSHISRATELTALRLVQVPYSMPNNDTREFPVLALARTAGVRGAKGVSHNVFDSDKCFVIGQHRRLLRASSERLSRGQARPNENNTGSTSVCARAKSEYDVTLRHSNRPEAAKCTVKNINDDILGRPSDRSHSTWPNSSTFKTASSDKKNKSAIDMSERHLSNKTRCWKSSSKSHDETVLVKKSNGKLNLDLNVETPSRKSVLSIKLNVNELPRSKTPITENDPDKLNMKHVIAFLQTSAPSNGLLSDDDNDDNQETINESHADSDKSYTRQMSRTPSPLKVDKNGVISGRHYTTKPNPGESVDCAHQLNHGLTTSIRHSHSNPMADSYHYGDSEKTHKKKEPPRIDLTRDFATKPKSFYSRYEAEDICIPENIRKLRDSNDQSKPFRLRRFLTFVPKCSETLQNSADSKTVCNQIPKSGSGLREYSRNVRKPGHYSRRSLLPKRIQTGPNIHLSSNDEIHHVEKDTYFCTSRKSADRRRLHARLAGKSKQVEIDNIVCLPQAHFEADSDEENSPFSTMPNTRNNRVMKRSDERCVIVSSREAEFKQRQCSYVFSNRPFSHRVIMRIDHDEREIHQKRPSSYTALETIVRFKSPELHNGVSREHGDETSKTGRKVKVFETKSEIKDVKSNEDIEGELKTSQDLPDWAKADNTFSLNTTSGEQSKGRGEPLVIPAEDTVVEWLKLSAETQGQPEEYSSLDSSTRGKQHVRLSLRKERHMTRELTYMVDMGNPPQGCKEQQCYSSGSKE